MAIILTSTYNDNSELAKKDLTNIDNEVFKTKITESGYTGQTVDLSNYVNKTGDTITGQMLFNLEGEDESKGIPIKTFQKRVGGPVNLQIGKTNNDYANIFLNKSYLTFGRNNSNKATIYLNDLTSDDNNYDDDSYLHIGTNFYNLSENLSVSNCALFFRPTYLEITGKVCIENTISNINSTLLEDNIFRNVTISLEEPAIDYGQMGDIWITYEN